METGGDPQTHAIIGACMEVHKELGHGFLEPVYQEALERELASRGLPFVREAYLPIHCKGEKLACKCKADFVCFERVIVELKALTRLTTVEHSQVINYLKASEMERGLLINFGTPRLEFKRFIHSTKAGELSAADTEVAGG
jgi:GxxExxY protein